MHVKYNAQKTFLKLWQINKYGDSEIQRRHLAAKKICFSYLENLLIYFQCFWIIDKFGDHSHFIIEEINAVKCMKINILNINKWAEEFVEMMMILLIALHCIPCYNFLIIQSILFYFIFVLGEIPREGGTENGIWLHGSLNNK